MNDRVPPRSIGLTAGGHRVHPTVRRLITEEEERVRVDKVPVVERYQDLAQAIHKTAIAPRADRFILGCLCGWAKLSEMGISYAKATMVAQQHVIDEADKLYEKLEPKLIGEDDA